VAQHLYGISALLLIAAALIGIFHVSVSCAIYPQRFSPEQVQEKTRG